MNRPDELRRALASVFAGSAQPDQVIVSDDGNGSAKAICNDYPGVQYQKGPGTGLGANRNACIRTASSELIAFIDDDVEVDADFVKHAASCDNTMITRGWELNFSSHPPRKVVAQPSSFLGFQNGTARKPGSGIVINATVFPRALFSRAQFDEYIRYGYEELDMARQSRLAGFPIVYRDDLHVRHYPSSSNRSIYEKYTNASRLYLTYKAYRTYEGNFAKAVAFAGLGGLHHLTASLRRGQTLSEAINALLLAKRYWTQNSRVKAKD